MAAAQTIRIGTSGWQYDDWRDSFYPQGIPQREWLAHYASVFDTVEINSTFYHLPKPGVFSHWSKTVPEGFSFAVKISRYLTHIKRLKDPAEPVERFMEGYSKLDHTRGPVVVQLPPSLSCDVARLDETLAKFPQGVKVAVEFRHDSWFVGEVEQVLRHHAAALVWADRKDKLLNPQWITAPWLYLRFHEGTGQRGNYGDTVLQRYAQMVRELEKPAFVYFNNDATCNAVRNALAFQSFL